jgi:hypothetical protein
MLRALVLALAALLGLGIAVPAFARGKPCTVAETRDAPIAALKAEESPWLGKCVRVRGIAFEGRIFQDRAALTEPLEWDSAPGSVVFLGGSGRRRQPLLVEARGRLQSCSVAHRMVDAEARATGEILMVSGYCHTSMENYLDGAQLRVLSRAPIPRLLEAEVPAERRYRLEVPAGDPVIAPYVAVAEKLRAALAAGDAQAFLAARHPEILADVAALHGSPPPDWLVRNQREAREDFRQAAYLRDAAGRAARGEVRAFVEREDLANLRASQRPPYEAVICWCTIESCAGRWPVTGFDFDNAPGRPYFCVRSTEYQLGPGRSRVRMAEPPVATEGFAEPPRQG